MFCSAKFSWFLTSTKSTSSKLCDCVSVCIDELKEKDFELVSLSSLWPIYVLSWFSKRMGTSIAGVPAEKP